MKELNWIDTIPYTTRRLMKGGVFLNVAGSEPNTMTIGWAPIGNLWARPVFVACVRPQRHTFELLKNADDFTVSVPTADPLKEALRMAGTLSGRDVNKFEGHGISAAPAQCVRAPIVAECGLHYECRILMRQEMPAEGSDPAMLDQIYPQRDMHTMFFGQIIRCYATDDSLVL